MARGTISYDPQTQTPDPSRASIPLDRPPQGPVVQVGQAYEDLKRGLDAASLAAMRSQDEEARAWASNTLASAKLQWSQELANRQAAAEPNAPEFTTNYVRDFNAYANDAIKAAPTAAAKKYLQERLNATLVEYAEKAKTFEAQARIDYRTDQFTSAIDNSKKLMNTDPSQFESVLAERVAEIEGSAMPPIKKSAIRQKAIDEISTAAVWSQIQKSPTAFLESIGWTSGTDVNGRVRKSAVDLQGRTGNSAFDMMPFEKRVQLFQQAIQAKNQIDMDADRATAKFSKQLSDDTAKALWGKQVDGKLKRADLEEARPLLSVDEYKSLLKASTGEAAQKSDPAAYRDVAALIANGKWQEAETAAFNHHKSGNLSNADLTSFVDRARSQGRQEGPKSNYESTSAWIIRSMDPGPLVHDPVGRGRLADAVKEFDDWFAAHPQATKPDIDKAAHDIVSRYKMVNLQDSLLGLPVPRSGYISRNAGDTQKILQDVAVVAAAAKRKYESGEYTRDEYAQEAELITRYKNAAMGQKKVR